jgi:hypothetical protein
MSQSHEELEAAGDEAPQRKSGRAVFDAGHTVWEWQTATGVFQRVVSEEQLSRLEAPDLQLVEHSSEAQGFAIYDSRAAAEKLGVTERVFTPRRAIAPAARSAEPETLSALRQFLRRLVPSM